MKKYIKAFGIALGIIILLMAVIPFFFKGKIRELAENQANKNLNAVVSLGDINISLFRNFPNAYIGLKNITILNKDPFQGDTLAYIPLFTMKVDLLDLINGSPYSVDKIRLVDPDIRLKVMHDGSVNWDIALPSDSAPATAGEDEPASSFVIRLESLKIENARLLYDDVSLPAYVLLDNFNHHLSGDLTASRTILSTYTTVGNMYVDYGHITYLNKARLELMAKIDADLANEIYTLEENHLKINELMLNFEGSLGFVGSDLNLLLTFDAPVNTFKNLLSLVPAVYSKDFETIQTDGQFSLNGYVKGAYNDTLLPAFLVNLAVEKAWFKYPDLPGTVKDISLKGKIENPGGGADDTEINFSDIGLSIMDNAIRGSFYMVNPVSDPVLDLALAGMLDLSDISRVYPLEEGEELTGLVQADVKLKGRLSDVENENYKAFQAMGSFLARDLQYKSTYVANPVQISLAQLNISPAYLDLVNLDAKVGNSDFQAKGIIEDYLAYFLDDGILRGNFQFEAGRIDLNEWIQTVDDEEVIIPEDTLAEPLPDTSEFTAFIVPANIDFSLNTDIQNMLYKTIEMSNVNGKVELRDSKLILKGLAMKIFGGSILMNGTYETTDPLSPVVDFTIGVTDTEIGQMVSHIPAMEKFAPVAAKTFGKISGNLNLASVLDGNMMPLYQTIQGLGSLKSSRLEVAGVNTLNALSDALKMDGLKSLSLDPVNMAFQIMEGMLNVKPFDLKAGNVAMNLGGWTSFTQEIGYELNMKIPRSAFGGEANAVLDGLVSRANIAGTDFSLGEVVQVKAMIDGTLTDPKIKLDLAGTGTQALEQVKEQVKQEVIQTVSKEAEKILADARQQADRLMEQAQDQADKILSNAGELAEETRKQANLNADKLEAEAKDKGALAVLAAKKTADEVRKEGDRQAQNINAEAQKQSENLLKNARQEADQIIREAETKANALKK